MTDEQYLFTKAGIQIRLQKATAETERALLDATQRAASELYELEKEYRGIAPRWVDDGSNQCLRCNAPISHGIAYCQGCQQKRKELEAFHPLLALDLTDKKAVEAFFADPANLDNPLFERKSSDESR